MHHTKHLAVTAALAALVADHCREAGNALSDETRAWAHHLEHRLKAAADLYEAGEVPTLPRNFVPRVALLLKNIGKVIDMTDPDSERYADSGADTVQALCEHEAETRALAAVFANGGR